MASQLKHTVMPSGGDFTSLDAAIDHLVASHANLVTADVYADIEIDGTWSSADTTLVDITGITADATRYINIYTTAAARHDGKWDTGAYILIPDEDESVSLNIESSYVTVSGLQIKVTSNASRTEYLAVIRIQSGVNCTIKNNILTGKTGITNSNCIILKSDAGSPQYIYNNIVFNFIGTGISLDNEGGDQYAYIYNNTVFNCTTGIYTGRWAKHTIKNNIVTNCTTDFSGYFLASYNNATDGDTAPTAEISSGDRVEQTFSFVDTTSGSEDLHLASNDAGAIGYGTSSVDSLFTDDIDGQTRTSWDIGADEYVAAAGATPRSNPFSRPFRGPFGRGGL